MFNEMKIGTKIWMGFGGILAIAGTLGCVAILSMMSVRSDSNKLDNEYVPEVLVANQVERNSLQTMYNIRGFLLYSEQKYLDAGQKYLAEVEKSLKDAVTLAEKSPNLEKLKVNAPAAATKAQEYKKLLEETVVLTGKLRAVAQEQDKTAAVFMEDATKYLEGQNKKFDNDIGRNASKAELRARLEKVNLINDMIDLGNAVRLARAKSFMNRDISLAEKSMPNFDKMTTTIAELNKLTHESADLAELADIGKRGATYKEGMQTELELRAKEDEVSKRRAEAAAQVLELAEKTSISGAEETAKIANNAATSLGAAVLVLLIGLAAAMAIGVTLALAIARGINTALSAIGQRLGDASQQVRSASEQLSSAAQQLASGAAEQASSIEETTASLEEMGGMVSNNVDNAGRAAELSQRVATVSEQGNDSMSRMQNSMQEILVSNDKIEQLVKVISAIGEKTQVMDEIVFQTKLLSFNASVEAERAGEHGRGFAVVAQEVGNLAQMSGKAAQEIALILSESIKNAEVITTENRKKVEVGAGLVTETSSNLKEILQSANTVSTGANQVLEASKEQASGIKQVNVAMSNLEKATQESAALAEEVASTSEELAAQTEMLNASVLELDRMINGSHAQNAVGQSATLSATHTTRTGAGPAHHATIHEMSNGKGKSVRSGKGSKIAHKAHSDEPHAEAHHANGGDDSWEKL